MRPQREEHARMIKNYTKGRVENQLTQWKN